MDRKWKIEQVHRHRIPSPAIVDGIDFADAKRRPAEIGFKATLSSPCFSIVLIWDVQAQIPVLREFEGAL